MEKILVWEYINNQNTFVYEYVILAYEYRYGKILSDEVAEPIAEDMLLTKHVPCFVVEYTKHRVYGGDYRRCHHLTK